MLYSTDGGLVWQVQTTGVPNLSLNGVDFVSLTTGWAVGNNNALVTTGTGGAAWTAQTSGGPAEAEVRRQRSQRRCCLCWQHLMRLSAPGVLPRAAITQRIGVSP